MEPKRILVLCGGRYAFPTLQTLGMEGFLCGVGLGKGDAQAIAVLERESENGLAFRSFPNRASLSELRGWIDELQPDYIFSISFPFLLSEEVLEYGAEQFINFHPGPLPEYRGPMPLFEVLRYQEKETAISVHFMNDAFDEGAVILQESIPVTAEDTYGTLAEKMSERTAMVALNMSQMLQFGSNIPRTEQDDNRARYFEKPEPEDTFIQWQRMPAEEIVSLIHACNPWNQGADTLLMGRNIKLLDATLSEKTHEGYPGKILELTENGSLAISCLDNKIVEIQVVAGDFGILQARRYAALRNIIGLSFN